MSDNTTSDTRLLPAKMEDYVYQPLADGYIRLVEVLSDTIDAPLRCKIFQCSLNDAPSLNYEALSYVWGPQEPLFDLLCGEAKPRVLRIGPNLSDALLHLRFHPSINTNPRRLWIDRICINQDDIEERASQVQLMHAIYRRCRQGLVWLGMDEPNTEEAFECARFIHKNAFGKETPRTVLAQYRSPAVSSAQLRNALKSLAKLTYRPWFERAWTFQEVILPSTVLMVCGKSSMALECLEACWIPARCQANAFFSEGAEVIFTTRTAEDTFSENLGRLPAYYLEYLLTFRREAKMLDPRDYIFSLLGLFSPSVSLSLSPSYSISVRDLFTAVAKHIIREGGGIRILCSVESPKHVDGEAFPSWVPDWRASSESLQNVLHNSNLNSPYRATRESVLDYDPSSNGNELHLYGIPIGAVDQAGRYKDVHSISEFNLGSRYDRTKQPITTALRQAQTLDYTNVVYQMIGVKHPARNRLADFFDIPLKARVRRRKCKQCPIAHTMPILSMEKAEQNPALHEIVQGCSENMRSLAFFTTDSRYIGFGPNRTAAGDQVFLLIGSNVPFILRPAGEKFELVGACYAHGIMYGEGLSENVYINNQFYPGSVQGGTWDFSKGKVPPAEWRTIEENSDNSHIGGFVCDGLAPTTSNIMNEELKGLKTRKYWLYEEGRNPVLINTKRVVIK